MAFPPGWPPRPSSGSRSIAVLIEGTADASYENNAYLFYNVPGANPFVPQPYVAPGDEKKNVPLSAFGPLPLGTGRIKEDASFRPDVFRRVSGAGTATSFAASGTTVTYTDNSGETYDLNDLNKEIRITGATSAANNGTFVITGVPAPNQFTFENGSAVDEDFPPAGEIRIRQYPQNQPVPAIWSNTIVIYNNGANEIRASFNGEDDHVIIPAGESRSYRERSEAGIALRSVAGTSDFVVEAW